MRSASTSVMVASPSRSTVKASERPAHAGRWRCSASSRLEPAMNCGPSRSRRAMRHVRRAALPSRPWLGNQRRPSVSQPGRRSPCLAEVFAQMAGDVGRRAQQRQHVDEAKQLDLDRLVAHAPFHEAVVPPRRAERQRRGAVEPGEDLAAVADGQRFESAASDSTSLAAIVGGFDQLAYAAASGLKTLSPASCRPVPTGHRRSVICNLANRRHPA